MKYNIWNKWDPLKVCMLGNNYAPEFFNGCDPKASDPLKRICEETLEDLQGYKEVLQDFGVEVIQPAMDPNERFLDNPQRYPRGPLQPRDYQLVIGNTCFVNKGADHPAIAERLDEYSKVTYNEKTNFTSVYPYIEDEEKYNIIKGADYPSWEDFLSNRTNKEYFPEHVWKEMMEEYATGAMPSCSSASCFMIGKKLFVGIPAPGDAAFTNMEQFYPPEDEFSKLHPELENFKVIYSAMDGHSDGNFHPIKPGAILSLCDVQNYTETFPGWDVCYLPSQSWNKVAGFRDLKKENAGKWYLAGETDNNKFTHFVETWLQDWVGYVEETVFDVNVLMLDEHHCCVANPNNEQVNTFLKKHKVEPVYVPWRHRFFWDGGLHCITLDLYREGTQKDYFI